MHFCHVKQFYIDLVVVVSLFLHSLKNIFISILGRHIGMLASWSYPQHLLHFYEKAIGSHQWRLASVRVSSSQLASAHLILDSYFIKLFDTGLQCEFIWTFFIYLVNSEISRSLGVPENSAFMDVEKILKIVQLKKKFWKILKYIIFKIRLFWIFSKLIFDVYDF